MIAAYSDQRRKDTAFQHFVERPSGAFDYNREVAHSRIAVRAAAAAGRPS